ncbi:MAG: DNA mismatch repair protein MutS [Dehalococcoidia bacterium]|nr:DNA mismatch repair protein MutS [Chloroflexota bacterium]MDP7261593.1 DNA mismatch repair protein MutS [Dehalococcoidia bacterium]|tara:strand:- start:295 stop:2964 length:2670 start_codon:yes stop_codon:yes gene_type:complete
MAATPKITATSTDDGAKNTPVKSTKEKKAAGKKLSPGRRQFLEFKAQYPDSLLLIRMGDFYEAFDDDAHTLSNVLGIALTSRESGAGGKAPLAGIPHHALDNHLGALVLAGLKIAIAEQTSDPAKTRGLVERAVVRVVTPGTVIEPALLDQTTNNYLAAAVSDGGRAGLAYVDISTSEFVTGEFPASELQDELFRLSPAELIADAASLELVNIEQDTKMTVRPLDEKYLDSDLSSGRLIDHFKVKTLEAFGCENMPLAIVAASAVLDFVADTQFGAIPQLTSLRTESTNTYMKLDQKALRDLEVFESSMGNSTVPTLFRTLNFTKTAMGVRTLRSWLNRPLLDPDDVQSRQEIIAAFYDDQSVRSSVQGLLGRVSDLERLTNRVRTNTATPRDLAALLTGLVVVPELIGALPADVVPGGAVVGKLHSSSEAVELLKASIPDEPSITVGEGGAIRDGFHQELDEVRSLSGDARSNIAALEADHRESTGIKNLKIGYNRVFGYYLEVSKANVHLVPESFERRQTLVNGERFITPELKELESKILNARDRISELEREIFRRVCGELAVHGDRIMETAKAMGVLDALVSMSQAAAENEWIRPLIDNDTVLEIEGGRHPVVESSLGPGRFVPNDIDLSNDERQVMIITGPNMSGKSTYIRQAAVLVLMAQVGSFIPATKARIGVVDRIFTRAGLSDDISGGQSTFMVEMVETASILNQATSRSLAVLDEIGRGTSTYDGLAIARSVAEHIHNSPKLGCKTLFATHYHEMTQLADQLPRAHNLRVAVAEEAGEVIFLYQIVPGGADRSYGVHVARLAGMPGAVVSRAWDLLDELENGAKSSPKPAGYQLQMPFGVEQVGSESLDELKKLDVANMTPLEAINALFKLQEQVKRTDD